MPDEVESVLGCWLVRDLANPKRGSVKGHYCSKCRGEVWVMPENLSLRFRIVCLRCASTSDDIMGVLPVSVAHQIKNN